MLKNRIEEWIIRDIGPTEFDNWDNVMRFALRLSVRIALVACGMVAGILALMHHFELLLNPLWRDLAIGCCIAALVGFNLTMIASMYMGYAVIHLAKTRLEFQQLSRTDMLSGLLNRRAFIEEMSGIDRGQLLVLDIDRFKQINDKFGHMAGDDVIVAVATMLREMIDTPHKVARIGGEEFAVLFVGIDGSEALSRAEKIRRIVESNTTQLVQQTIAVTVSGGLADLTPLRDFSAAYAAADKALYLAKTSGRNQMVHENDIRHLDIDPDPDPKEPFFTGSQTLRLV
ncbi:GGDEF domain-containing protein [Rhizobium sp. AAP43]|uniref:GGDEF domain-containing protein n=1 Tax=Rhizobium sp. AAP43 TaxID=1523420 RepID=UPI0006B8BB99|nr:GGDEF domain-containing protein [Rhizobium sp. AAP43]